MTPIEALRHHVTGAIERGEKTAIAEQPAGMKPFTDWNLDDENEAEEFAGLANSMPLASLATALGCSVEVARMLRKYADWKQAAITERKRGKIAAALSLERECEKVYRRMPAAVRW